MERTLAVIRRLMERATRYEAITGRGALVAGLAALGVSAAIHWIPLKGDAWFLGLWSALAVAGAVSVVLPALRGARENNPDGRRVSAQAATVAGEVAPVWIAAVVLTVVFATQLGGTVLLPCAWMMLHGLSILATAAHAPRRLLRLGYAFLVAGALAGLLRLDRDLAMAVGFGALNIAYGLLARLARLDDDDEAEGRA